MINTLIAPNVRSKILLVQRAFTELDDQNRICGSLDLPLSNEGIEQATEWAKNLAGVKFGSIVAAAGIADKQTAKILAGNRRVKIRVQPSWQNLDHGLWQGKYIDSLKENCNRYYRQWLENPESVAPPSGETTIDVMARVKPAFSKCLKKRAGEVFVVVAPQPLLGVLRQLAEEAEVDVESGSW